MSTKETKETKDNQVAPKAEVAPRGLDGVKAKAKAAQEAQAKAAEKAAEDKKSERLKAIESRKAVKRVAKLTADRKVGTNAMALPWPQDPSGSLFKLKQGGTLAAKRVNGDPKKLKAYMATLKILAAHAQARFEADTAQKAKARENHLSARVRNETARREAAERKASEYEAAARRTRENAGIEVPVVEDKEAK